MSVTTFVCTFVRGSQSRVHVHARSLYCTQASLTSAVRQMQLQQGRLRGGGWRRLAAINNTKENGEHLVVSFRCLVQTKVYIDERGEVVVFVMTSTPVAVANSLFLSHGHAAVCG